MKATQNVENDVLLRVEDLKTYFFVRRGVVKALDGVSFTVKRGQVLGLIGESGCGKSVTSLSILKLVPPEVGKIIGGSIFLEGEDLVQKSEKQMRKLRGRKVTMIQQNPDSSLNPVFRIGDQIAEAIGIHQRLGKREVWDRVIEMLRLVRIPSPDIRSRDYPHQMSGGMRQRVAGAIGLSCSASLLIADEPTTNLDVTTQMEYLKLLKGIQAKTGLAIIFITHDFGIVEKISDQVAVMYAGRIVEKGPTEEVMHRPKHPYTVALLEAVPRPGSRGSQLRSIEGQPPDPVNLSGNCSFAPRCPRANDECRRERPPEVSIADGRHVSCFHAS